jgi:hypothetical protein
MAYTSSLMSKADEVEFTPEEIAKYELAKQKRDVAKAGADEAGQLSRLYRGGQEFNDADRAEAQGLGIRVEDLYQKKYGDRLGRLDGGWTAANQLTADKTLAQREVDLAAIDRERRQKRIAKKEEVLLGALDQETSQAQTAIDEQLAGLLQETGIGANAMRAQTGAVLAERGMSRSTMANQAIGDVTQQELQTKAQQRMGAMDLSQQVQNAKDETLRKIQMAKETMEADKAEQLEAMYNQQLDMAEKASLDFHMRSLQEQAMASAKDKAFVGNMIGGIFQSAGLMAAGGLFK